MSVWKFWNNQKHKVRDKPNGDKNSRNELDQSIEDMDGINEFSPQNSPTFERHKNRHQMSVSRSGRYKQKLRKRSGILDHPDFLDSAIINDHPESNKDLSNPKLDDGQYFCEEEEEEMVYDYHPCESTQENGKNETYKNGAPRLRDLQKRADIPVVTI